MKGFNILLASAKQTEYIARIINLADNHNFKLIDPLVKIFCVENLGTTVWGKCIYLY